MLAGLLTLVLAASPESQARSGLPPVEDTFLDSSMPETNFGRELVLVGGPNKAILLRFPEFGYQRSIRRVVKSAKVVLTSNGAPPILPSDVGSLRQRWLEGPGRAATKEDKPENAATWSAARSGPGGVRWAEAGAGGVEDVRKVDTASSVTQGSTLEISGLESLVQAWVDDPNRNFGLRLEFDSPVVFRSAESLTDRPRLVVEYEETKPISGPDLAVVSFVPSGSSWTATIKNLGDAPMPGGRVVWALNDRGSTTTEFSDPIPPGAMKTFEFPAPPAPAVRDPRSQWISARVTGSAVDANPANDGLMVATGAVPVDIRVTGGASETWLQDLVTEINDRVFAQSRASFAPDGSRMRIRLEPGGAAAIKVDVTLPEGQDQASGRQSAIRQVVRALVPLEGFATPPSGIHPYSTADEAFAGWLPDTRDDTGRVSALPLPARYWMPRISDELLLPSTGHLGMAEVAFLQNAAGRPRAEWMNGIYNLPKSLILRCFDANALPLSDVTIEVFQTDGNKLAPTPVYSTKTTRQGSALLSSRPAGENPNSPFGELKLDGSNSWFLIRASKNGITDAMWLPVWALWSEFARGNTGTATIECRFMLPPLASDETQDLALNKIVADSKGRFPAELTALVDGNPTTSVVFEGDGTPYWVEIDLGRDRTFCQIEIQYAEGTWETFDIVTYNTSQSAASAFPWFREFGGTWQSQVRGRQVDGQLVVTYRANPLQTRYIRFIPATDRRVTISGIRVRPVVAGN